MMGARGCTLRECDEAKPCSLPYSPAICMANQEEESNLVDEVYRDVQSESIAGKGHGVKGITVDGALGAHLRVREYGALIDHRIDGEMLDIASSRQRSSVVLTPRSLGASQRARDHGALIDHPIDDDELLEASSSSRQGTSVVLTPRQTRVLRYSRRLSSKEIAPLARRADFTSAKAEMTSVPYRVCSLAVVGSFVKSASTGGRPCTFIGPASSERKPATCYMDGALHSLVFSSSDQLKPRGGVFTRSDFRDASIFFEVALAEVIGLSTFTDDDDDGGIFSPGMLAMMSPEERGRLISVTCKTHASDFCVLEDSLAAAEEFKQGMGMLVAYPRSARPRRKGEDGRTLTD